MKCAATYPQCGVRTLTPLKCTGTYSCCSAQARIPAVVSRASTPAVAHSTHSRCSAHCTLTGTIPVPMKCAGTYSCCSARALIPAPRDTNSRCSTLALILERGHLLPPWSMTHTVGQKHFSLCGAWARSPYAVHRHFSRFDVVPGTYYRCSARAVTPVVVHGHLFLL
jgi:hypothetical protein